MRKEFDCLFVANAFALSSYEKAANNSDDRGRLLLYGRSHRSLEGRRVHFARDTWKVDDGRVSYRLPLRDDSAGFDWACALSALGHDVEVKQLYRFLVANAEPGLFIDVGANFGQHSQYFLAAGWDVLSFEPNPNCTRYHEFVCQLNGWKVDHWREVALSDTCGVSTLTFPEGQEWLGRVGDVPIDSNSNRSIEVPLVTLESLLSTVEDAVIKIDIEGHELKAIRGFPHGLGRARCVIFEALSSSELDHLTAVLTGEGLEVFALARDRTYPIAGSIEHGLTNFAASPQRGDVHAWLRSRMSDLSKWSNKH